MNVLELLKKHEGFRGQPYHCTAGKLTIGYGRNLEANPLTEKEAEVLLINDVLLIGKQLRESYPWYLRLDDTRQGVLINMAYNLGMAGIGKFKNMLAALEDGNYSEAARHMLDSRWANQVGSRALELAELMKKGQEA